MKVARIDIQGGDMFSPGAMIMRERKPLNLEMPFSALYGFLTPGDRFFVCNHFSIPQIDVRTWRLIFEGAVKKTLELTYDEIQPTNANKTL